MKRHAEAPARAARKDLVSESVEMLHQMFQAVDVFSRQMLRDFGVTGPQIWALRTIEQSEVVSMGGLAQGMHLHMSTVTGIIDRLEAATLVRRERSEADGRVMEIRLTPRGRAILARAPEPPRSKAARGIQRLAAGDLRRVHSALRLIAREMDLTLLRPEEDPDPRC